jgi:hypothetical protein
LLRSSVAICVAVLLTLLPFGAVTADDQDLDYPNTLGGLRQLAEEEDAFSQCTSVQVPERCWTCIGQACSFTERLAFNDWSVSSNASASHKGRLLDCAVSAKAIHILINYLTDPREVTFLVPERLNIIGHEARPIYLIVDGERFVNPANGRYMKKAFENDGGAPVDERELLDKMQSAYRITVETWNVDDEKFSTSDLGDGLDRAIRHCDKFAAIALADID